FMICSPPTQSDSAIAASYEARKVCVRPAMPSFTAGRLLPNGIFVRPRMEHYLEESRQIMAIVGQTGALIEQVSIDEAYLDWSDVVSQPSRPTGEEGQSGTGGMPVLLDAETALLRAVPLARELKR